FPEAGLETVLGGQGGLDHLLLDLAVQRDVDLLPDVVLADVDEGVLLGELGQGGMQPRLVARIAGHDRRLQRGRREVTLARAVRPGPDRVADPDLRQARQPGDLAGPHRIAAFGGAVGEDADGGYLAFVAAAWALAELHSVPDCDRPGEQAGIGRPLPRAPA